MNERYDTIKNNVINEVNKVEINNAINLPIEPKAKEIENLFLTDVCWFSFLIDLAKAELLISIEPFIKEIDWFLVKNQNVVKMVKKHKNIIGTINVNKNVIQLNGIVTNGIFQKIDNKLKTDNWDNNPQI